MEISEGRGEDNTCKASVPKSSRTGNTRSPEWRFRKTVAPMRPTGRRYSKGKQRWENPESWAVIPKGRSADDSSEASVIHTQALRDPGPLTQTSEGVGAGESSKASVSHANTLWKSRVLDGEFKMAQMNQERPQHPTQRIDDERIQSPWRKLRKATEGRTWPRGTPCTTWDPIPDIQKSRYARSNAGFYLQKESRAVRAYETDMQTHRHTGFVIYKLLLWFTLDDHSLVLIQHTKRKLSFMKYSLYTSQLLWI